MNKKTIRNRTRNVAVLATVYAAVTPVFGATVYWDVNSTFPGSGAFVDSIWDTSTPNWTLDETGTAQTIAWNNANSDIAVFAAGADGIGSYTVGLTGTSTSPGTTAGAIVIEEGNVTFGPSGVVGIGAGSVTIASGAVLSINTSARISASAGSTFNFQGGTLINSNPGNAGSFVDVDSKITLGAAGGTFSYSTPDRLSIIEANVVISGVGALIKSGAGVLAIASASTYSGGTIINQGELRVRTSANRLPTSGAVTVNSPGIFNLNNVSQEIGSLSGDGGVGLGGATLTIGGSANTTFSGVIENTKNAGANGTTAINGKVAKTGTGTLILQGLNTYSGSFTISAGTVTVTATASLSGPTADLIVNGGTLNLDNSTQTVENLSGTGGTINLGAAHLLVTDPVGNTTFAGSISGAGSFEKRNVLSGTTERTLVLSGTNTYTGTTTISGGTLQFAKQASLYNGSAANWTIGTITVSTDATLAVNAGGADEFTAGNIATLVGLGVPGGGFQSGSNIGIDTTNAAGGNFEYASAITNPNGGANVLGLTKLGTGILTLSGANTYTGRTNVVAGILSVTGSLTGTAAVNVSGTLGGTGTIAPALNGNVTLTAGGKLAPGTGAGTLAFNLTGTGTVDLTGGITSNTGALVFELGTLAGSDRVVIAGGPLTIGAGLLQFDDFAFTALPGLDGGDYVLFDTNSVIAGTLGANVFGQVNGLDVSLQLADGGKDLVLHVIPEPGTSAALLAGLGVLAVRRRRS